MDAAAMTSGAPVGDGMKPGTTATMGERRKRRTAVELYTTVAERRRAPGTRPPTTAIRAPAGEEAEPRAAHARTATLTRLEDGTSGSYDVDTRTTE